MYLYGTIAVRFANMAFALIKLSSNSADRCSLNKATADLVTRRTRSIIIKHRTTTTDFLIFIFFY